MEENILKAKDLFYEKEYDKAREFFLKENKFYEAGLCSLLLDDIKSAKRYWKKDKENKFASSWGLNVLDYINSKVKNYPSFLQVRAFYEVYVRLLVENNLLLYAQNLINVSGELSRANPETPKFMARVLNALGYDDLSLEFVKRIKEYGYMDPEAFFISAEIQFHRTNYSEALDDLKCILDIMPEYYPAVRLKNIIMNSYK